MIVDRVSWCSVAQRVLMSEFPLLYFQSNRFCSSVHYTLQCRLFNKLVSYPVLFNSFKYEDDLNNLQFGFCLKECIQLVSTTKINWLTLFREIIAICFRIIQNTYIRSVGKIQTYRMLKQVVLMVTNVLHFVKIDSSDDN